MKNNLFYIFIFCFATSCNSSNNSFSLGETYEEKANNLKEKTHEVAWQLLNHSDKGVKTRTFYTCNDTVFSEDCSLYGRIWFDESGRIVSDSTFEFPNRVQNNQYLDKKIIVTTSSYDGISRIDTILLNDKNQPINESNIYWKYDSSGRIIYYFNKRSEKYKRYREDTYYYLTDTILHIRTDRSPELLTKWWDYYIFDKQNRISKEITYVSDTAFSYHPRLSQFDSIVSYTPRREVAKREYLYETNKMIVKIYEDYEEEGKLSYTFIVESFPDNKTQKMTMLEDDIILSETYYKYDSDIVRKGKKHRNTDETQKTSGNHIIEETKIGKDSYERRFYNQNGALIKEIKINPSYTKSLFSVDENY